MEEQHVPQEFHDGKRLENSQHGHFTRRVKKFFHRYWYPYLLFLPVALLIVGIMLYPLGYGLLLSLQDKRLLSADAPFIGFRNYVELAHDPVFWKALVNSLKWTVVGVVGTIGSGFAIALLLHRNFPGRSIFRTLFLFPWAVPTIVAGIIFTWFYDPTFGYLNEYLRHLGLISRPVLFLSNTNLALFAVAVPMVWKFFPFAMLAILAGLQAIDEQLYDAAAVDGANSWQQFVHVTLPGLRSILTVLILLESIWIFNVFDFVYILTRGGPAHATELLSTYAYSSAFEGFEASYGAAIATVHFLILVLFSVLYFRVSNTGEDEQ